MESVYANKVSMKTNKIQKTAKVYKFIFIITLNKIIVLNLGCRKECLKCTSYDVCSVCIDYNNTKLRIIDNKCSCPNGYYEGFNDLK